MKRFLLLFFSAVLVCSLMIVPAFASESYSVVFDGCTINTTVDFELPFGSYTVTMLNASGQPVFTSDIVDINSSSFSVKLYSDGIHAYTLWGGTGDGQSYFEIENCNQDFPPVWSDEVCLVFTLVFDPADPVIPSDPVPDPEPDSELVSPLGGIGEFFSSVMLWLASLASVVVTSPVLTVLVVCFVIVGFVVALGKRLKS